MFKSLYEPAEDEIARLAAAPEGSLSHELSKLPVNITGYLQDLLIELPRRAVDDERTMVVVPYEPRPSVGREEELPRRRHDGWWACIVVASNDPSYGVGGHRLHLSEAELVRGTIRTIDLPEVTQR